MPFVVPSWVADVQPSRKPGGEIWEMSVRVKPDRQVGAAIYICGSYLAQRVESESATAEFDVIRQGEFVCVI